MQLVSDIRAAESDPQQMEQLYRAARQQGVIEDFQAAVRRAYQAAPENTLLGAWFYRFEAGLEDAAKVGRRINWLAAVPLSLLTGLIFWALSDFESPQAFDVIPQLILWWSPIATMSALVFLALSTRARYGRTLALGAGLLASAAYVLLAGRLLGEGWQIEQYVILAAIHIPLLCWVGLGIAVLGFKSSVADRFAFLIKSIEVMVTAGLYLIAGMAFGGITVGLFAALGIQLPEVWMRLIAIGGFGLLPVLAVASTYDPDRPPARQAFEQGLSQLIGRMMRLLLPLTLAVLVVYVFVIPFNFRAPYENRDLLIVYNLMLFGIMGLLIGVTPMRAEDLSPRLQQWLRTGIIAVAILVTLISLYALSATVYRTLQGGLTPNRLTIIGWNAINIGILGWLVGRQFRDGQARWSESLQSVFSLATNAYMVWGLFLLVAIPILF